MTDGVVTLRAPVDASERRPATSRLWGARLRDAVVSALGDLLLELGELQHAHEVAGCRRDAGRPDDRGDCRKNPANLLGVDLEVACSRQIEGIRDWGASTAISAAMRTSINVSASRLDASIEAAVISVIRSRTGVSVVSAMGAPFGRFGRGRRPRPLEPFQRDPYSTPRASFPSSRSDERRAGRGRC